MIPAVRVADKSFTAVSRPLDVAIELFRRPHQANVFSVQINFGAETAAHVWRNHAHFVLGQPHHKRGQQQAFNVWVLVRHIQRVVVVGATVTANGRARLHSVWNQTVVGQVDFGDVRSGSKSCVNHCFVANSPFVAMVVWRSFVQGGGRFCFRDVDHSSQNVVVHFDQLGCIFGLLNRLGNNHGHVVAYIAHLALRKDGVRWLFHGAAVGAGDAPTAWQAVDFVGGYIGANEYVEHARCGFGCVNVDAFDVGVGVRRAHKHGVALVGQRDVVGVLAAAG